jgi:very-short-patch-repair endonuclease
MKKHPADGALARARSLRQSMTEAERRLWQILRSHQMTGYKFRRQVPIGRYIADFVCHEARLIVEIDGGQHDRSSPQEAERSGFLEKEGYRILRFWNNEVLANPDGVHQTIADELGRITPTHPSAMMGEGFCLPLNNLRSKNS